ncbi:MAG: MoxR family ATPase [Fimbriimonadaceae bacterium]|nr:MoxR family ATPase [Fimbriimonadaceae bacterium]
MSSAAVQSLAAEVRAEFAKVVVGQQEVVDHLLIALLLEGHVLLQGVPGVAKTLLVRTLAEVLGVSFKRLQFTPDMMPSDIVGTQVFDVGSSSFHLRRGPVFCHLLLADEINRTPPKTQAALLEVMEERQASIDGTAHALPQPFLVCATVNPVEFEGTYPLPEAQLDRFLFQLNLDYPTPADERELLRRVLAGFDARHLHTAGLRPVAPPERLKAAAVVVAAVQVSEAVLDYLQALLAASRESRDLQLGASPRAGIALLRAARARAALDGRDYALPDDLKALAPATWRHRLLLRPEAEIEGRTADDVIADLLDGAEVPLAAST